MKEFNSDNSKLNTENTASKDGVKPYSAPVLTEHGNVSDMIQGNAGGTADGFLGGTST